MNILIVDDMEQDRKMLRRTIHKKHPDYKISEVSNLSHMYAELSKPCELLFLDISLNGNNNPDNEGLNAIYDIIDGYPGLPLCLITGHFKEKVHRFLGDFLTETLQVVNILDKGKYKSEDLLKVYSKADKYRLKFQENLQDKGAAEDLLQEGLDDIEKKFEEKYSNNIKYQESQKSELELHKTAYNGNDWLSRIEAENRINSGTCKINALELCIEFDSLSQYLCPKKNNYYFFPPRATYIVNRYDLKKSTKEKIKRAWRIRNLIVHGKRKASLQDAKDILNVVELLQGLRQKKI